MSLYAPPMSEPVDRDVDLGPLVPSNVVGEVFWAMDHPDADDDGCSGVREPLRPPDSPSPLTAEAEPNRE